MNGFANPSFLIRHRTSATVLFFVGVEMQRDTLITAEHRKSKLRKRQVRALRKVSPEVRNHCHSRNSLTCTHIYSVLYAVRTFELFENCGCGVPWIEKP